MTSTLISVTVLLAAALLVAGLLAYRRSRAPKKDVQPEEIFEAFEARLATMFGQAEQRQSKMLERVHDDIRGLQSDLDWLAGERLIDQAVSMARSGSDASVISKELGLSLDDARTIQHFRRH